jgi:hypothetical protein
VQWQLADQYGLLEGGCGFGQNRKWDLTRIKAKAARIAADLRALQLVP